MFTDWYGQQSCTAGRAAFITGQSPIRTGLTKVGLPGAPEGMTQGRPDDRHAAQGAGLRHRPVRQEPPRRPRRHAADRTWLRRVLRQPLPPERRGGAGEPRLPEEPRIQEEVRAARRDPQLRRRPHHRHRPADAQAHGDDRRGGQRQGARLHGARREGGQAVLPVVELHPHAHLHAPEGGCRPARRASASTPTAWSSTTATSARCSRSSRNWASTRTPSSCTRPTTAPRPSRGRTAARRCSAARRTRNWEGGYRVPTLIKWPGVIKPGTVINDIGAHEDMLTHARQRGGRQERPRRPQKGRDRRPHLQGAPRRLRPRPGAARAGRLAAQGVHLLDRRRQRCGPALRGHQGHLPRAGSRTACASGRTPSRCCARRS